MKRNAAWTVLLLLLCAALLLVTGRMAVRGQRVMQDSQAWITHTKNVQLALEGTLSWMRRVRAEQHGYRLDPSPTMLQAYQDAKLQTWASLSRLQQEVADNTSQRDRATALAALAHQLLALYERELRGERELGAEAQTLVTRFREQVGIMAAEEDRLLSLRMETLRASAADGRELIWGTVALAIALLMAVAALVHRNGVATARAVLGASEREQKAVGEALAARESEFQTLADNIDQLVWMARDDGSVVWLNRRWNQSLGVDRQAAMGSRWLDHVDPAHQGAVRREWAAALAAGSAWESIFPMRRADGGCRWFLTRAQPIRDAGGGILRWFGTHTDVTAQRESALALSHSEARFRAAIENLSDIVWTCNPAGEFEPDQPGWTRFSGQTEEDYRNSGWSKIVHPDDLSRTLAAWNQAVGTGQPYRIEHRLLRRDGQWRFFSGRAVAVRDAQGSTLQWIGVHTDITEVRQAEAASRDAERRKDEFIATLSHELRNPLAPILSAARLLTTPGRDEQQLRWCVGVMQRQVGHMARLLDDLLDVSRITRGRLELRMTVVDLGTVIDDAIEASQPLLASRQHRFTRDVTPDLPLFEGDPVRLTQVFSNLLHNAAKFTDPGGHIALTVQRDGDQLTATVRDNGIGLSSDQLGTVFDMFSQVRSALHRSQSGLGIGLGLARGLVELHGGRIEVRSAGLGQGAEFIVRLPLTERPALAAANDAPDKEGKWAQSADRRVLVADDNEDAAESLALWLRSLGHVVETAHDGVAAVELAARFEPDVAVLDIGMPRLDGYSVARRLRASARGGSMRLVALTGWGQAEDKRRASEAGFDAHLTKPVDPERLRAFIDGGAAGRDGRAA